MQIEIETADKTGTFLGSLWEGKENVSIGLLEAGLAKLHPSFSTDRVTEGHLLVRAEESAKKKKLKVGGVGSDGLSCWKLGWEAMELRLWVVCGAL